LELEDIEEEEREVTDEQEERELDGTSCCESEELFDSDLLVLF